MGLTFMCLSLAFVSWLEMHLEHLVTSAQGLVVKTLVVGEGR